MPPSPHMSQRTVPMKDNREHRVNQLRGQHPPEEGYLACHRQGRPDPGRLSQTEHPLLEKMGEHSPLEECPLHNDPPDVPDGRLRVSRQQQGAPRQSPRARLSRSQPSTSVATSAGPVLPVVTRFWSAPRSRAARVARSHSTDSTPPVKHQKLGSALRERGKTPATKAAPRSTGGSVESAATPSKVGKGQKKPGKSGKISTAEKTAISPAAQEPTASSPAGPDRTASSSPAAQEATASSPAGPDRTASIAPLAQTGPPASAR
ncbi:hypothetical protein NDU88_004797 [Pleurodeles waltl]|uniref:Uncharacterized protein n=1 Tax=Pleurodeles waltl TaxID=8319 RepID=A0AAV7QD00_PLEWA|nr:hypothetical protein NDU88_004797 [Pleurodeles waltl]